MAATIPADRWTPAGPIRSHLPMDEIEREVGLASSSVAEPAALGLFAFATGTFTQNVVNAGWFPATTMLYMVAPLLIMTGVVQFLAGMWAFRKGDTFSATAFGSFGGVNVAYTVFILLRQGGWSRGRRPVWA